MAYRKDFGVLDRERSVAPAVAMRTDEIESPAAKQVYPGPVRHRPLLIELVPQRSQEFVQLARAGGQTLVTVVGVRPLYEELVEIHAHLSSKLLVDTTDGLTLDAALILPRGAHHPTTATARAS